MLSGKIQTTIPNCELQVHPCSGGEASTGQHICHVHAAWDDTLQCRKAVRTLDGDLALRLEGSSHQPNLRRDYLFSLSHICTIRIHFRIQQHKKLYCAYPSFRRALQILPKIRNNQRGIFFVQSKCSKALKEKKKKTWFQQATPARHLFSRAAQRFPLEARQQT